MAVVTYVFRSDELEKMILVEMESVTREQALEYGTRVKRAVQGLIRARAEVNTEGGLADSIQGFLDPLDNGGWQAVVLSDEDHAIWFEEGTGIFGPRKSFIFPRGNNPMIFYHRGLQRKVYAFKVKGQPGKHPFRDGLKQVIGGGGALRKAFE